MPYKKCEMCEYGKDEVNDIDDVLLIKCKKCENEDKQAEEEIPDYKGASCVFCNIEDYDCNGKYFEILDNEKKWICVVCEAIILYKEYNRLFN